MSTVVPPDLEITPFDISELTSGTLEGTGVLDVLLKTVNAHLADQFKKERIRGTEYASAFVELYQACMTNAVGFVMSRHKLPFELANLENEGKLIDAQIRQIDTLLTKVPHEIDSIKAGTDQTLAQTEQIELVTSQRIPAEILNLTKQGELIDQQILESTFRVQEVLPVELLNLEAQTELAVANKSQVLQQTTNLVAEKGLTEARTDQVTTETTTRLPAEVANLTKQGEVLSQQVLESQYRVQHLLPQELLQLVANTNLTDKRSEEIVEQMTKIPHEITLLGTQTAAVNAETLLTNKRIDQITQELAKIPVEIEILEKQVLHSQAQTSLITSQTEQVSLQTTKIPKEIALLDKEIERGTVGIRLTTAQAVAAEKDTTDRLPIELANLTKQGTRLDNESEMILAQKDQVTAQTGKVPTEIEYIQAQIAQMTKQNLNLEKDYELKEGQLSIQLQELEIAKATLDLRRKELDNLLANIRSTDAQAELYTQKAETERAQTVANAAEPESVLGLNKQVLSAQRDTFFRDAEQKVAKLYLDSWIIRRQTDEGTEANIHNLLQDNNVGKAMDKLLRGIDVIPSTTT